MNCKNCEGSLRTDYSYCSNCGAKVIRNRLTIKNLWYDVTERFFNVDNTFLKTFLHLFSKPEVVVDSYVKGVRKRYLNPIAYFTIALTLSGILLYILKKFFLKDIDFSVLGDSGNPELGTKIMNAAFDFSTFIFALYIPVIACISWVSFNKINYNLSEFFVSAIYSLAHFSVFTFFINLIFLMFYPEKYLFLSLIGILILAFYTLYVNIRLNSFSRGSTFWRSILYMLLFIMGYFGVSMFLNVILLLTGALSFSDFIPQK